MPVPVEQVLNLRSQGFDDNQIIAALQRDGFSAEDISNAISQANIRDKMQPYPATNEVFGSMAAPETPEQTSTIGVGGSEITNPNMGMAAPRTEEIIEAIIDEKWNDLVKDINKIVEWKEKTDGVIGQIQQKIADLDQNFKTLHDGILGKIGEYDEHITDVSTEIKAMEKVFEKVLPTLTENVNELSRIVKDLKTTPAKKLNK